MGFGYRHIVAGLLGLGACLPAASPSDVSAVAPSAPPTASGTSSPPPVPWVDVQANACSIKARMLGTPVESVQTVNTDEGPAKVTNLMYESADKKSAMGIFCTDTPRLRTTKATDEHILDSVRDGVLHNLRGKLLSETPFALGRFPGREVAIKTETQEALGRIVFLRSRGKILTLMALGVDPALAREFVTGVTLVEKASGK